MLSNLTIQQASQLLKGKKVSSAELTKFYLDRIKKYDGEIRAFITIDEELSLNQAKESDLRRSSGLSFGDLDGVPIAIKDVLVTKDFRTTAGSKMLQDFESPYDATVIRKMRQAGMVFLGKTNMDEFAMGSSTENSGYFTSKNPWDITRVPGGSSGGSAAAVAADMAAGALGSDTGGSIRQPAALCGIVGLKPSYGSVSRYGLIAMASSLDQVGPMTKTVNDAKILYRLIGGSDENDPTSQAHRVKKLQQKNCKKFANANLQGLKVGIPEEYFLHDSHNKLQESVEGAIKMLQNLGAKPIQISLPNTRFALSVYYILMPVEVASNLARYDGIRFGIKNKESPSMIQESRSYIDDIKKIRSEGFGAEVKRRIILGTFASSAGYAEKYYLKAQKVRTLVKRDFDLAFETVDLIVGPVSPTPAFRIGEKTDDPLAMYLSDIYTIPVNLAGLAGISIPCGFIEQREPRDQTTTKLPVGLQLIAPQFHDELLFDVGQAYEQATDYQFKSPLS